MRRIAWLAIGATILARPAAAAPASSPTVIYIPGRSTPQHSPRPPPDSQTSDDLRRSPLVGDEAPQLSATRRLAPGESFLKVKVRHSLTGVLATDVVAKGWLSGRRKLAAGTGVFGIPMGGPDGRGLVWCAPQVHPMKGQADHWTATCLPFGDASHLWIDGSPALMPRDLSWNEVAAIRVGAPDVRRQPVDFAPMTLSYAFGGWDARGWLKLEVRLDWGEGPQILRGIALQPGADGAASVKLLGGEMTLWRDASAPLDAAIEVRAAPTADAAIIF